MKTLIFLWVMLLAGVDTYASTIVTQVLSGKLANRPTSCTIGQVYFATDQAANNNVFFCQTANNWVNQTGATLLGIPASNIIYDGTTLDVYLAGLGPGAVSSVAQNGGTPQTGAVDLAAVTGLQVNSGSTQTGVVNLPMVTGITINSGAVQTGVVNINTSSGGGASAISLVVTGTSPYTNIAATVALCPAVGTGLLCYVQIPYTYTGGDQVLGFTSNYLNADTTPYAANVFIEDLRKSDVHNVSASALCVTTFSCDVFHFADARTTIPDNFTGFFGIKSSLLAGGNFQTNGFSNYNPLFLNFFSKTPGQIQAEDIQMVSTSENDPILRSDSLSCIGQRGAPSFSEDCEDRDVVLYQGLFGTGLGSGDFEAVTSSSGTSLSSLVLTSVTQLPGSLGALRDVVDFTAGPSITTTESSYSCPGTPCVVTVASTSLPVSPAYGVVNTAIPFGGGTYAVTPSLVSGLVSNFSTAQLVCVADAGGEPERMFPSAVGGTTVTLTFQFQHATGFYIYTGGLCGYDFDAAQDDATTAKFPNLANGISGVGIQGTAHRMFFILGSPTASTITVAYHEAGFWPSFAGNTDLSTGGTVNLWKAALVTAISTTTGGDAGQSGGTIPLGPNIMTVTPGHTIAQPMGNTKRISPGNYNYINLWGDNTVTGGSLAVNYGGIMSFNDSFITGNNYTPLSLYQDWGGTRPVPEYLFAFNSPSEYPFFFGTAGKNADIAFGQCYYACNNQYHIVVQEPNGGSGNAADYIMYDQVNKWFKVTYNNGTSTMLLNGTGGGGGTNATTIQGVAVSSTAPITGQALVYNSASYVPTSLQVIPTCASMASGVLSGPCITASGAVSNFQYVDSETANYTVPTTGVGSLISMNGGSSITLSQCGVGNFVAGSTISFVNASTSVAFTVTTTTSQFLPGASTTRTVAVATGSGATLVAHGFTATCEVSGNYALSNIY